MRPGEQKAGAVLVEQAGALQEADELVPEELLGRGGVDLGHGRPVAGGGPAAAGEEGVHVRVEVSFTPKLWTTATMPGRKPCFSPAAATAISSCAVSHAAVQRDPSSSR